MSTLSPPDSEVQCCHEIAAAAGGIEDEPRDKLDQPLPACVSDVMNGIERPIDVRGETVGRVRCRGLRIVEKREDGDALENLICFFLVH